ncbi:hypothetical protein [Acinetobacter terrestris]|uniref:Uncharacterized protein n=1 Tax=Acinetobacter terrestris TaxID=2529843 RepID=A0ABX1UX98_9GAMM|nr:hypothetical protein [Acinetobacter terrestris]NNH27822.1 hypothetical protein [Acinetobacter terrestris]
MSTNAIKDLAYSIFRNIEAKAKFINIKEKIDKGDFFAQCVIELMQIRKIEYLIVKNEFNVILEIGNRKLSFWIVEIPELSQEFEYIEYFYSELVSKLYCT